MAEKKIICPLMGGECIEDGAIRNGELVACRFWVHVIGKNPQTGQEIDNADCAFAWTPMLLIENSNEQRKTCASIDTLRSDHANAQAQALLQMASPQIERIINGKDNNN